VEASSSSEFQRGRRAGLKEGAGRTIAQTFCLVGGLALIGAGVLGFFFGGAEFNTGTRIQGQEFIVFEVNGWHNVVHIATGAFLVLVAPKAKSAATGAAVFGIAYVGVVVWGFIDGNAVANLIPVNTADNWLHVALALSALLAAGLSGAFGASAKRDRSAGPPGVAPRGPGR